MGKRLKRIFQNEIKAELPLLLGKELQFVLKSNVTIHAVLNKIVGDKIEVKDYNSAKHIIIMNEIEEVIMDFVAPY
jgi:hypothetical protein